MVGMKNDNPIPSQRCVCCGYVMTETSDAYGDRKPSEGDVSICLACGALQIFGADLSSRNPTQEERLRMEKDQRIIDIQIARAYLIDEQLLTKGET
jgi:Zn ribbon nucleic-acid-binding protein